ncbi:Sec61p translocation complex subunit [Mortierella alpina]|nr:Sec61p translocation complex subunit [Mortierella alpina]
MDNEFAQTAIEGPKQFIKDGVAFINRCTKPDRKEFMQITQAVSMGFFVMGVIGFVVKLIHIPINNILVYSYPPMFTNYGYVPSIFMDTSPKQPHWTCDNRWQSPGQELTTVVHHDGSRASNASGQRVDYIQIWLDAHPADAEPEHPPSPVPSSPMPPSPVPSSASTHQDNIASRGSAADQNSQASCRDGDDDSMEWESCLSSSMFSPMSRSVPDVNQRSMTPSPLGSRHQSRAQSPEADGAVANPVAAPIMMSFRQHAIRPRLLLQGRSPCIFLGQDAPINTRVHRRVNELLHNASIQRIRSWLKTAIEPNALEQWRNISLLHHLTALAAVPGAKGSNAGEDHNCPICFKTGTIMKQLTVCGHKICWKCEQDLDRAGNISCPLCRRIRVLTTFTTLKDLFQCTIGLHPSDYMHPLCLPPPHTSLAAGSSSNDGAVSLLNDAEELERIEHELSDRYLWEPSASFLDYLQSAPYHPGNQYFQLNAVQDLCYKSSTERYLPEYNDRVILEPPTSGLLLPPHRLYIALIHFCLDMLTLPNPVEFQNQRRYQRERLLLQLVILFLVPTDEFSPRASDRIFDVYSWIEHGQFMLGRIHRFMETKAVAHMKEMEEAAGRGIENRTMELDLAVFDGPSIVDQGSTVQPVHGSTGRGLAE